MVQFRTLEAREVNARVSQVFNSEKWTGASILLYKDARVDMALLDEIYGQYNWKVDYQQIGSSLFCTISLWDKDKNEWVAKQSNGTESNMEAEKGQASDAFKRAGFMVGIGRELYTAPQIMVELDKSEVYQNQKTGKWQTYATFTVDEIGYNEHREITQLVISKHFKRTDEVVYRLGKPINGANPAKTEPTSNEATITIGKNPEIESAQLYKSLQALCPDKEKLNSVLLKCGCKSWREINGFVFSQAKKVLNET